ncbi:MAG: ABC transporter permease [Aristaeellaceae bacterium]
MTTERRPIRLQRYTRNLPLHIMLLPSVILLLIYSYGPMSGLIIAFQKFIPAKGLFGNQKWVGLDNFTYLLSLPGAVRALNNTVVIAFWKIVLNLVIPVLVALMLNEVKHSMFRRAVQTVIYLPHFLSWIILSGVLIDILSPSTGLIGQMLRALGIDPPFFLGSNDYFRGTMIVTDIWKEFGYGSIVYLAAITAIDPSLYEAAIMDGANRWQQTLHITVPGISMVIVLMMVLSLGNVLNAGFDQIYNLYSPSVYETGDIIDTFIYRIGLIDAQFGVATAMGLFKSLVSTVFISVAYFCAYKFADYRIF